ncbi:MAG TPA: hypothetical protein VN759_09765, partial [Pseudolysinimonas sp.]|nr:hypothetical protein [Pseudolysinimonas sp.]
MRERLDRARDRSHTIVVRAPRGYGKTSAVATWVGHHPEWSVVWIGMGTLIGSWSDAVDVIWAGLQSVGLDPGDLPDEMPNRVRIVTALKRTTEQVVIVVDNVGPIDGSTFERIAAAAEDLPTVTAVLITRSPSGPAEVPAVADGRVGVVVASELGWDSTMAHDALERRGIGIPRSVSAQLTEYAEGRGEAIINTGAWWHVESANGASATRRGPERLLADWTLEAVRTLVGEPGQRVLLAIAALYEVPRGLLPDVLSALPDATADMVRSLVDEDHLALRTSAFGSEMSYSVKAVVRDELAQIARDRLSASLSGLHAAAAAYHARPGGSEVLGLLHRAHSGEGAGVLPSVRDVWVSSNGLGDTLAPLFGALSADALLEDPPLAALRVLVDRTRPGRL